MEEKYQSIREEIKEKKGTDASRTAEHFAKDQYADPYHFIVELLQNTEDALSRAADPASRTVCFALSGNELVVSHFGKPFDQNDVVGICSFLDSTKSTHEIGHFGIGFKSVFNITNCPKVHSGQWHFEIRDYVFPYQISPAQSEEGQTLIQLQFKDSNSNLCQQLLDALQGMDPETLLFLRHIRELVWTKDEELLGSISVERRDECLGVQRRTLRQSRSGQNDKVTTYIVATEVLPIQELDTRPIELAWLYDNEEFGTVLNGSVFVSFPTNVRTKLRFHIQGSFDPIASRENLTDNAKNHHLMDRAGHLLAKSLQVFKENNILTADFFATLPLAPVAQDPRGMYTLFQEAVKAALADQELLPTKDGGWATSSSAYIVTNPRFYELDFFRSKRHPLVQEIAGQPTLRRQLKEHHGVALVSWDELLKVRGSTLEEQSDQWIQLLYEIALDDLTTVRQIREWKSFPWVRLADGRHVAATIGNEPQAYLQSSAPHIFPPVKGAVIDGSPKARQFIELLGVSQPRAIDVIREEIIPRYKIAKTHPDRNSNEYAADLGVIGEACSTSFGREKITPLLKEVLWVPARLGADREWWTNRTHEPDEVLEGLYDGLYDSKEEPLITFLDDKVVPIENLKGGLMLKDFMWSGVPTCEVHVTDLPPGLRRSTRIRQKADGRGFSEHVGTDSKQLLHLNAILSQIRKLQIDDCFRKTSLLWEVMLKYPELRNVRYFWTINRRTYADILPNPTILKLRDTNWVPSDGTLRRPSDVTVEELPLEWQRDSDLENLLQFKGFQVEEAAKMIGIEAICLQQLKDLRDAGVSNAEITASLSQLNSKGNVLLTSQGEFEPVIEETNTQIPSSSQIDQGIIEDKGFSKGGGDGEAHRVFIPFARPGTTVKVSAGNIETTQERRDEIGKAGIKFIMDMYPHLKEAPHHNPGFDLYEENSDGKTIRWIEVKSTVGNLDEAQINWSRSQFDFATDKGVACWLYIVENVRSACPNLLRIKNPALRVSGLILDASWRDFAEVDPLL